MNHSEHILNMLKGHTAQKPLRGNFVVAKLGLDPDTINDLLDDLQGRGAINRAEITQNGETYTALWPTGITPRNLSWKQQRDNGVGLMGAQLAHNVQQAAEASRTVIKPETPITSTQEPIMPRISRPALPVEPVELVEPTEPVQDRYAKNNGPAQRVILATFTAGLEQNAREVWEAIDRSVDLGVVKKVLSRLAQRGLLAVENRLSNGKHWNFYRLNEALCSELPGNLRTLSKIGADDHVADAGNMVKDPVGWAKQSATINPPFAAEDIAADPAPDLPENAGGTYFALFDSGTLLITAGDEFIALPIGEAQRLANYLRNVSDALYANGAA